MTASSPSLRPDYRATQAMYRDTRSEDRLRAHYVLERRLARRLRNAPSTERPYIYTKVYNELFGELVDHPQKVAGDDVVRERRVRRLSGYLRPFLSRDQQFLEIGCGDALLSMMVAAQVGHAYALDVTDVLIEQSSVPKNLSFLKTTGTEIPLDASSIDFAVSDQLMEHLHPDDAQAQLAEIFRVLKPGGAYLCMTPNRVTGPHDVSHYFDYEATGFHLQEYDSAAILALFRAVGFRRVKFVIPIIRCPMPRPLVRSLEKVLLAMPRNIRAWASRRRAIGVLVGLNIVGIK
jgi:ubiquinone/menaquinone biosynthesis C-methylase UbiE